VASGHDVGGNPEAARLVVVSASGAARPGRRARALLLLPGMLALLAALWGGLLRLGWQLPVPPTPLAAFHGPLMVAGFLGTVIGMERAVALGGGWAYLAPLASGLGALALVAGSPGGSGPLLTTAGSLGLVLLFVAILFRQTAPFTVVMALGALAWLAVGGAMAARGPDASEPVTGTHPLAIVQPVASSMPLTIPEAAAMPEPEEGERVAAGGDDLRVHGVLELLRAFARGPVEGDGGTVYVHVTGHDRPFHVTGHDRPFYVTGRGRTFEDPPPNFTCVA